MQENTEVATDQGSWSAEAKRVRESEYFAGGGEGEDAVDTEDVEEERIYRQIIGYKEMIPPAMKSSAVSQGLYNIIPASAKINIRLQGLDGFRFGDLFSVNNILPHPYDDNCIFMLTGYEHTISSEGWFTEIGATLIASAPPARARTHSLRHHIRPQR